MKPTTFTELVQAAAFAVVLGLLGYKVVADPDFGKVLENIAMIGVGFWWGSSRSSQAKDQK